VHGFRKGGNLTISGVADASFNQNNLYIASVPTPTSFTAQQVGANSNSSGGQAVTLTQGGCVTGGAFYDGTAASVDYRGNFFYGDCNSGRVMRARIDPVSNDVLSVDHFATGIAAQVDVAGGPDGALYYIGTSTNNVFRAAFNASSQGIVLGNQNLRIDEGGEVFTTVRLAIAPVADITVSVARSAGDTDVGVLSGANLTFNTSNWMRPQNVRLGAATDPDASDDSATVTATAPGLSAVDLRASVLDLTSTDSIFSNGFE
jgi:hypothetical protein